MTGYGAAQAAGTRLAVEVEVRSVNARNLKIAYRTPSLLSPREAELDKLVRTRVRRGTLTLYVRLQLLQAEDVVRIRREVIEGFEAAVRPLREAGMVEGKLTPDGIAALPGAIESGAGSALRPTDWKIVKDAVCEALDALDVMRLREATHLVRDLRQNTKSMRKTLDALVQRLPAVLAEHHQRLRDRVDAILADREMQLDDATLAREMALIAERSDVAEEVTRLTAHIEEFERLLTQDTEVGRTLDFIAQEMLREANTMGSKSQDVELARSVIALKSAIDRLKEQAANLE
jgi:uncharacterized protein (TIGR00255 family)